MSCAAEIYACYIVHIYLLISLSLSLLSYYLGVRQTTCHIRPFYLGLVFLVLFGKSTKNFGLAFLSVSCRLGCLKRPLRASNLFGVSAAIPTAQPIYPSKSDGRDYCDTQMLCRSAERVIWERTMFCVREVVVRVM